MSPWIPPECRKKKSLSIFRAHDLWRYDQPTGRYENVSYIRNPRGCPGFASPQTANFLLFVVVKTIHLFSLPPQVHRTCGSLSFPYSSEKTDPPRRKPTHDVHVRIPRYHVSECHLEHGLVDSGRGFACLQAVWSLNLLPQVSRLFGQCA